ncbi:MAG: phosphoribosylanthranilate isomerase [Acidobacteriota bacterium]|nr:MAG: phosphoribosylanthranilate isomerase [Acidobacteriota bacterium]
MDRSEGFMIKVCGLTTLDDALCAVELGANTLGFNFYPKSPRYIEPETAAEIIAQLPAEILNVGVIVRQPSWLSSGHTVRQPSWLSSGDTVRQPSWLSLASASESAEDKLEARPTQLTLDAYQVHGVNSEEELDGLGGRIIVATSPADAIHFPNYEIIIDTSWGTGKLADWGAVQKLDRDFILSGGLTPDNVDEAIRVLNPTGVDVCSGVESSPGRKDKRKLEAFLKQVKKYDNRPRLSLGSKVEGRGS